MCRADNVERRKTTTPKRKFRPVTPKITATNPPLLQAPPQPNYEVPLTVVRANTPWSGAGKTSDNLFNDRQWLLPKGYLTTQNKEENIDISSLKEKLEISDNPKDDKCGWGPDCPFCKAQEKKEENPQQRPYQTHKPRNQP